MFPLVIAVGRLDQRMNTRDTIKSRARRLQQRLRRVFPSHMTIAYKLSFTISILMVACIGLMASLVIQHQNQVLRQQLGELGHTLVSQIAQSAEEPLLADDRLALEVLATNLTLNRTVLGTAILGANGKIITRAGVTPFDATAPAASLADVQRAAGYEWQSRAASSTRGQNLIAFASPIRVHNLIAGHVVVTLNRTAWEESLSAARKDLVIASLLVLIIGSILAVFLGRRLSQPIYELIDVSRALDKGLYHVHFPERRKDELGNLMASFNRLAQGLHDKHQVERKLSRYLSPGVAEEILKNNAQLGGERVNASVVFADIVGFTRMSEELDPEAVACLLNQYFAHIVCAADLNHGMIDKYIGDCAMLVFGVPQADPGHPFNAVACALMIQRLVSQENDVRAREGLPPIQFRIGINSGEMLAGNMGTNERMDYTVVGDAVNLASRISAAAEPGEILITESVYQHQDVHSRIIAEPCRAIQLRGISNPVNTWRVIDFAEPYRHGLDERIQTLCPGPPG